MNLAAPSAVVRPSHSDDLPAIARIYAHHVRHGFASFEQEPPDVAELARRRDEVLRRGLPYLVADGGEGRILGYTYAGPYRTRPAYRFSIENSVYVEPGLVGRGLGRILLGALIERCAAGGWRQMIAVIGDSANLPSIHLHERMGFARVGLLPSVGFKHGRWVDSVLMQRALGAGDTTPPDRDVPR